MKRFVLCAGVLSMLACGGCAVAVPVATGVAGAVPAVRQSFGHGQEESFWLARYGDVVNAAVQSQVKLSLTLKEKTSKTNHTKLTLADDRGEEISLLIERLTDTVTRVRFDAGSQEFGGFAHLMARQMVQELKESNAFVVQWSDDAS